MVYMTRILNRIKGDELGKHLKRTFIDKLRVYVKSGNGGDGLRSLGGIGGDGGSIFIKANNSVTLRDVYSSNLRKRYIAKCGENSKRTKLYGNNSEDIFINVPPGITAVTDSGTIIGEVNVDNEALLIAKGGKGGSSHNGYKGQPGSSFSVNLDLKLIADIGLIGFPNAGKSTLLSLVSRAQPKIGNYPFTTLNPQLGTIEFDDKRIITIADLPGLVEGAHFNRGMGHKFLKHISRTKINLFIIDINGFQLSYKYEKRSPFETLVFLNKELELYDQSLIGKPSILAINKIDSDDANKNLDEFMKLYDDYENSLKNIEETWQPKERINFKKIFNVSAKNNINIRELCLELRELIDNLDDINRAAKDSKKLSNEKTVNSTTNINLV